MTRRRLVLGLLLIWAALVVGGLGLHGRLHPDGGRGTMEIRAATALPANHRIEDADLAVDASDRVRRSLPAVRRLLGRYLAAAKGQGEVIGRGDVTELPTLPAAGAGPATVLYQLPEPHRALADLLDVGARVRLCAPAAAPGNPPCHPGPLEVLAVHPAGPGSTDAWLLLGLPAADEPAVHRYLTADGRYPVVADR
jgi:hypothetical protein